MQTHIKKDPEGSKKQVWEGYGGFWGVLGRGAWSKGWVRGRGRINFLMVLGCLQCFIFGASGFDWLIFSCAGLQVAEHTCFSFIANLKTCKRIPPRPRKPGPLETSF